MPTCTCRPKTRLARAIPSGRDLQSLSFCERRQPTPQPNDFLASSTRVVANASAELHDRLVQFGLQLLLQNRFAALDDLLDVGTQLARLRIDQLEFLLDAEGKDMIIHAAN